MVSQVSISGRVSESKAKELLKKQLGGLGDGIGNFLDMKTGAIKSKKPKKKKKPQRKRQLLKSRNWKRRNSVPFKP